MESDLEGLTRNIFPRRRIVFVFSNHRILFRYLSMILENFVKFCTVNTAFSSGQRILGWAVFLLFYLLCRDSHGGGERDYD